MNLQSHIIYPNNCKPGDVLWACAYSQNHKTKQIHKVVPMMGILTLTNNFIDESETTYEKDIFYVENKDLLKRVEEYLKTLK